MRPTRPGRREHGGSPLLLADAIINLLLGVVLVWFPDWLVQALGVPAADPGFYAGILGAVLFGIGIALWLEWRGRPGGLVGLGLGGAVAINLSGGLVLAGWLLLGDLALPLRGALFLWGLVLLLVGLSSAELVRART